MYGQLSSFEFETCHTEMKSIIVIIFCMVLGSDRRSGSVRRSLSLTLTLSLTLPDLNLTIFPSMPCLVSGR